MLMESNLFVQFLALSKGYLRVSITRVLSWQVLLNVEIVASLSSSRERRETGRKEDKSGEIGRAHV